MEPITVAGIVAEVWYTFHLPNGKQERVWACPDSDGIGLLLLTPGEYEVNDGEIVDYTLTPDGRVQFQGQETGLTASDLAISK